MREKRYSGHKCNGMYSPTLRICDQHQESHKFQTTLCINLVYAKCTYCYIIQIRHQVTDYFLLNIHENNCLDLRCHNSDQHPNVKYKKKVSTVII